MRISKVFPLSLLVLFVGAAMTLHAGIALAEAKLGSLTCFRIAGTGKISVLFDEKRSLLVHERP